MRLLFFMLSVGVIMLGLAGCQYVEKISKPQKPVTRNLICVVDFSSSRNAADRQQFYAMAIKEQIINNLGPFDRLTIIPLDKSAVTNSVEIISEDLPSQKIVPEYGGPKDVKEKTEKNLREHRTQILTKFDQEFPKAMEARKSVNGGTDIVGLLGVLKNRIKPGEKNYFIFFSDMMNFSPELNMEKEGSVFNLEALDSLIQKAPSVDLKDVTVAVITGDQPDVQRSHFELVQKFWTKYFEKNGAKLFDYSSATTSKLNEIMVASQDGIR